MDQLQGGICEWVSRSIRFEALMACTKLCMQVHLQTLVHANMLMCVYTNYVHNLCI